MEKRQDGQLKSSFTTRHKREKLPQNVNQAQGQMSKAVTEARKIRELLQKIVGLEREKSIQEISCRTEKKLSLAIGWEL